MLYSSYMYQTNLCSSILCIISSTLVIDLLLTFGVYIAKSEDWTLTSTHMVLRTKLRQSLSVILFVPAAAETRQGRQNGCAAQHLWGRGRSLPEPGHCGNHLLPVSTATFQGYERTGLPVQDGDPGKCTICTSCLSYLQIGHFKEMSGIPRYWIQIWELIPRYFLFLHYHESDAALASVCVKIQFQAHTSEEGVKAVFNWCDFMNLHESVPPPVALCRSLWRSRTWAQRELRLLRRRRKSGEWRQRTQSPQFRTSLSPTLNKLQRLWLVWAASCLWVQWSMTHRAGYMKSPAVLLTVAYEHIDVPSFL